MTNDDDHTNNFSQLMRLQGRYDEEPSIENYVALNVLSDLNKLQTIGTKIEPDKHLVTPVSATPGMST